jgi:acyl-CoA thioesterase FadM
MNLILRLLYVLITARRRPKLAIDQTTSELTLITMTPNDLDLNLHVNNGRYLPLCDLSRIDLFVRTGLLRLMLQRGWRPIIAEHTMIYRKSLGVFKKFKATMQLTHWDEKYFYMTHCFSIGDKIIAVGTSKGVIRDKNGVIPPVEVVAALQILNDETN